MPQDPELIPKCPILDQWGVWGQRLCVIASGFSVAFRSEFSRYRLGQGSESIRRSLVYDLTDLPADRSQISPGIRFV